MDDEVQNTKSLLILLVFFTLQCIPILTKKGYRALFYKEEKKKQVRAYST